MTRTPTPAADTPLAKIQAAAEVYGMRSFDNYVQIRSVAEQIRDGLCEFLDNGQKCVYLVPPQGAFGAQDYGSGAYSASGKGFLPLEPIAFGLAVQVSTLGSGLTYSGLRTHNPQNHIVNAASRLGGCRDEI